MKNIKKHLTVGLLSVLLIPNLVSLAEPPNRPDFKGDRPPHGGDMHQMLRDLDLSKEQKEKIHLIMEKHREAIKNDINSVLNAEQKAKFEKLIQEKETKRKEFKENREKKGKAARAEKNDDNDD